MTDDGLPEQVDKRVSRHQDEIASASDAARLTEGVLMSMNVMTKREEYEGL